MKRINLKIIQSKLYLKNKMEIDTVTLYQLNMTKYDNLLLYFSFKTVSYILKKIIYSFTLLNKFIEFYLN